MSMSLVVTWAGSAVPSLPAWQAALDAAGLPAQLSDVGDAQAHRGFWPVVWQGRPSGFEWQLGPADETLGGPAGGSTAYLVAQGDNAPAAIAAAAALARLMEGQLEDPQAGETHEPDEAVAWAWEQIAECQWDQATAGDSDCPAETRDPVGLGRTGRILGTLLLLTLGAVALTLFLHP
jgi:hypothetical protein